MDFLQILLILAFSIGFIIILFFLNSGRKGVKFEHLNVYTPQIANLIAPIFSNQPTLIRFFTREMDKADVEN